MTEAQWHETTDLQRLLYYASVELGFDRKIRLFSIACMERVLGAYGRDVTYYVQTAKEIFDDGCGSIRDLQVLAETDSVSVYQAPFHLARHNPLLGAYSVLEGIAADTGRQDHEWLPVFYEIFGNPFHRCKIKISPMLRSLARAGASAGQLADFIEEREGENSLVKHLRESMWHPRGCWVQDYILEKGR